MQNLNEDNQSTEEASIFSQMFQFDDEDDYRDEISAYLSSKIIKDVDPLTWWKENKEKYWQREEK